MCRESGVNVKPKRRLTLAFWCRKGILGMAALELKVVELMAKHMHSSSGDSTLP